MPDNIKTKIISLRAAFVLTSQKDETVISLLLSTGEKLQRFTDFSIFHQSCFIPENADSKTFCYNLSFIIEHQEALITK